MVEFSNDFAGAQDAFGRLWTPHRMVYIKDENRPTDKVGCPFCLNTEKSDDEGLIVYRGILAFVIMNLFPYSPGHVLVCPYRHISEYNELTDDETIEIAKLTQAAIKTIKKCAKPEGFNLGINQGAVAGAGIAAHLHQHVVPRWSGDTNFLPIIAQTRAIPQLLGDARKQLSEAWIQK